MFKAIFQLKALDEHRYAGSTRNDYVAKFKFVPTQDETLIQPNNGDLLVNVTKGQFDSMQLGRKYVFTLELAK